MLSPTLKPPNITISLNAYPLNLMFCCLYCTWVSSTTEWRTRTPLSLQSICSIIRLPNHPSIPSVHLSTVYRHSTTAPSWSHPLLRTQRRSQRWWGRWQRFLPWPDRRHPTESVREKYRISLPYSSSGIYSTEQAVCISENTVQDKYADNWRGTGKDKPEIRSMSTQINLQFTSTRAERTYCGFAG